MSDVETIINDLRDNDDEAVAIRFKIEETRSMLHDLEDDLAEVKKGKKKLIGELMKAIDLKDTSSWM